MKEMAEESNGRIELAELPEKSVEERPLYILKIRSADSYKQPETKPVVFIEGGKQVQITYVNIA
jgi:hypothetical protein